MLPVHIRPHIRFSRALSCRSRRQSRPTSLSRSFASAGTLPHHQSPSHSTVNTDEIAHFSRLSSLWWDERGEFGMLHKMNPARIQFLRDKVTEIALDDDSNASLNPTRILRGLNVLDVGCGGGLLSESLTRLGANTLGIDASASNISIASLHASADPSLNFTSGIFSLLPAHTTVHGNKAEGTGTLTYTHTSVEELLIERGEGSFDIVCSMEVIEHVDNPRDFLDSCARLVKPGGHLLLSTIARTPLAYFLTIFAAEDLLGFVSKGTHTFSKYVNPEELEGFFRSYRSQSRPWISGPVAHRLQAETRGIIFVPWNNEWVLTPRGSKWAEGCNYLFWVRRPLE